MRPEALEALRAEVARQGSKGGAARVFGVSRAAVSQLMSGTYPAAASARLEARIMAVAGRVECPHLGQPVARSHCATTALGPCPSTTPEAYRAWCACQSCPLRPATPATTTPAPRRRKRQGGTQDG